MASLDVANLFASIPIEATIENCVNYLFFDKSKIDDLTKQDVYYLLSAPAKESLFIFLTSLYRQTYRVVMGSPLGKYFLVSF